MNNTNRNIDERHSADLFIILQHMNKKDRRRWLLSGAIGTILFGSGFSIAVEASHWKHTNEEFWIWVGGGTIGIALMVMGLYLLIRTGLMERRG